MDNRLLILLLTGFLLATIFSACSGKEEDTPATPPGLPVLTTSEVTNISHNNAVCGGTVTSDGGAAVTSRGVCLSLTPDPKITGIHTIDGSGTGTFTSTLSDLLPDTLYYATAYATNSQGTAYGNVRSFRTGKQPFDTISDIDGNKYPVIPVGTQLWLGKNLTVTRYRNGDPIPNVTSDAQWKTLSSGAFCTYDHLPSNAATYGYLYNWHAVSDSRGICPAGYHVASDAEWALLVQFLGGSSIAGGKLKSTGTIEGGTGLWYAPNTDATNSSSFGGLPGGSRINYGPFYSLGNVAIFWSSSDTTTASAWHYILDANNGELKRHFEFMTNGFSVRCCRD
jgi:uncharacterized protein (TIGR02145 family)